MASLKNVIITGASSGVGKALALKMAERGGYSLFLTGRNTSSLQDVVDKCRPSAEAFFGVGDVGSYVDTRRLLAQFNKALGPRIDVLIANAGLSRGGLVGELQEAEYDMVMDANVKGVFNWCNTVVPLMKQQGSGQIVVTSSIRAFRCRVGGSLYCASKFAVQGFVGCLREELKGTGVKAGTINPAGVATPWWTDPERGGEEPGKSYPFDKMLTPEAVADGILSIVEQPDCSDIERIVMEPHWA